jgi:restriction endonuclease S subunit
MLLKINITGSAQGGLNSTNLKEIKIPLPPIEIQQQIVSECEAIDLAVSVAREAIIKDKSDIDEKVESIYSEGYPIKKLDDICKMQAGKFVQASEINDDRAADMYPCYGGNGLRGYTRSFTHEGEFSLVGRQGALCGNVHKVSGQFHATEHAVVVTSNSDIDIDWLYYQLKSLNLNQYATGTAQPGLSVQKILTVTTPVPPLPEQQKLVSAIEQIEKQIADNQIIINQSAVQKQAVMKKYL